MFFIQTLKKSARTLGVAMSLALVTSSTPWTAHEVIAQASSQMTLSAADIIDLIENDNAETVYRIAKVRGAAIIKERLLADGYTISADKNGKKIVVLNGWNIKHVYVNYGPDGSSVEAINYEVETTLKIGPAIDGSGRLFPANDGTLWVVLSDGSRVPLTADLLKQYPELGTLLTGAGLRFDPSTGYLFDANGNPRYRVLMTPGFDANNPGGSITFPGGVANPGGGGAIQFPGGVVGPGGGGAITFPGGVANPGGGGTMNFPGGVVSPGGGGSMNFPSATIAGPGQIRFGSSNFVIPSGSTNLMYLASSLGDLLLIAEHPGDKVDWKYIMRFGRDAKKWENSPTYKIGSVEYRQARVDLPGNWNSTAVILRKGSDGDYYLISKEEHEYLMKMVRSDSSESAKEFLKGWKVRHFGSNNGDVDAYHVGYEEVRKHALAHPDLAKLKTSSGFFVIGGAGANVNNLNAARDLVIRSLPGSAANSAGGVTLRFDNANPGMMSPWGTGWSTIQSPSATGPGGTLRITGGASAAAASPFGYRITNLGTELHPEYSVQVQTGPNEFKYADLLASDYTIVNGQVVLTDAKKKELKAKYPMVDFGVTVSAAAVAAAASAQGTPINVTTAPAGKTEIELLIDQVNNGVIKVIADLNTYSAGRPLGVLYEVSGKNGAELGFSEYKPPYSSMPTEDLAKFLNTETNKAVR